MYLKKILLLAMLSSSITSNAQHFGYQGKKLEISVGTEITTNPTYAYYAGYGEKNDVQSGIGLSFSPVIGLNYSITKRFGIGVNFAKQTLFVGYRTPDAGSFNFSSADSDYDYEGVDLENIPFRIMDKNRYRGLTKKEINLRYYVNKNIANASSYIQFGFGMYNIEADNNEVYTYGFYEQKGGGLDDGEVSNTITKLNMYETVSNTKIPTFKYLSFGYFFRKELPFMDGMFVDLGITLAPLLRHSEAEETTSRGKSSFEYYEKRGVTSESIEKYIITNTWMYVRRQQGIKTHLKISYLF